MGLFSSTPTKFSELKGDAQVRLSNLAATPEGEKLMQRAAGDKQLEKELVALASASEKPEKPGFFGRFASAFTGSLGSGLLSGVGFAAMSSGIRYGLHKADFKETAGLTAPPEQVQQIKAQIGQKVEAEYRAENNVDAKTALTKEQHDAVENRFKAATNNASFERWGDNQVQEALKSNAINSFFLSTGLGTVLGTVMKMVTGSGDDKVYAYKEQIWDLMNQPQTASALPARGGHAHSGQGFPPGPSHTPNLNIPGNQAALS